MSIKHYHRAFLNEEVGVAAIEWTIEECAASVKITDCNRTVNLDFDSWWDVDKQKSRYKIRRLIDSLTMFEKQLLENINK